MYSYDNRKKAIESFIKENKIPIYRGCSNESCFCTGACREIIGYRDKIPGEKIPFKFEEEPEYELGFCENCFQMTNHLNGVCQKCKTPKK